MSEMLSVVIPAYNEEANVEPVYERLKGVLDDLGLEWELIFSVDPSTDRTEELIIELGGRDPRVKMLRSLVASVSRRPPSPVWNGRAGMPWW